MEDGENKLLSFDDGYPETLNRVELSETVSLVCEILSSSVVADI